MSSGRVGRQTLPTLPDDAVGVGAFLSTSALTDDLIRARGELRFTGDTATMHGHFAVFNEWTEIDSRFEGHFIERIAPGAFRGTFREHTPKVLFQHGRDPQIADKPLGPVEVLREDLTGAYYEVRLLDTAYNREIIPGLEAGLFGSSFRFNVMSEQRIEQPQHSAHNPNAIPERTITEAKVHEFGPVTFPAYEGATAGVRSLTDWYRSGVVGTRAVIWTSARRRERLLRD